VAGPCRACCCRLLLPPPHLQTTKGNPATGITKAEFGNFVAKVLDVLDARRAEAGLRRGEQFILCWDNAAVHKDAAAVVGDRAQRWPQPAHSPDMNKPIEHVHGILDAHMHKWLAHMRATQADTRLTPDMCKAELLRAFNALPTTSIKADVQSLADTWQAIIAASGDYVSAELS
jgi:hypothetical protein